MLIAKKFAKVFEIAEFLIRITITYSSLVVKYQVQNSRARMPGNSGHLAKSCFPNRKNQDFFFKCPLFAHAQQKYMPSTMPITDCQVIPSKNAECQVMPSFMPSKIPIAKFYAKLFELKVLLLVQLSGTTHTHTHARTMNRIKTADKASISNKYRSKINRNRLERDKQQQGIACCSYCNWS